MEPKRHNEKKRPPRPRRARGSPRRTCKDTHPRQPPGTDETGGAGRRTLPDRLANHLWSSLREIWRQRMGTPPRSSNRGSTSSSGLTGKRCRKTVATSSSVSKSWTWPTRWWVSAVSVQGRSLLCSKGETKATRSSSRSKEATSSVSSRTIYQRAASSSLVSGGARTTTDAGSQRHLPRWTKGAKADRYLYWRQLREHEGSALVETMTPVALVCRRWPMRWTLARHTPDREIRSNSGHTSERARN